MQIPDSALSRVRLIGTSKYRDEKLPDLPQVGQGIRDLASALTDSTYGLLTEATCEVAATVVPILHARASAALLEGSNGDSAECNGGRQSTNSFGMIFLV